MARVVAAMKTMRKLLRIPRVVSLLLCPVVLAVAFALWRAGYFESLELRLYDVVIAHRPAKMETESRVVIVGVNDTDIQKYGWALDDEKLAQALEQIVAAGPIVVGLDLYRDLPEPRNGRSVGALNATLAAHTNIICIYTDGVAEPPVLKDQLHRIGFNSFPVDRNGVVRRAMLLTGEGAEQQTSLAAHLAFYYLREHGIIPKMSGKAPRHLLLGKADLPELRPDDGAYVREDDMPGFEILLDYKGGRDTRHVSLDDVLSRRVSSEELRGRVVLVGIMARSVNDFLETPLQSGQYGIRLHAEVVDQLLRMALDGDRPTRFWPVWAQALWIILWCLVGKVFGFSLRSPVLFCVATIAGLAALTDIYWFSLQANWWVPSLTAAAAFVGTAVLVTSYMSFQEKNMRSVLMDLFGRQVSKGLAEAMWADRDSFLDGRRPRAQELTVTVLFTDLKGFTPISEKMEPTVLYDWLNVYLGEIAQQVLKHGGVLKQFTGDGLMAIFGVPKPRETREEQGSDATNAVRCALAMGRRLVELNREWQTAGKPTVSMRAGIYTGSVAAGSIGSSDRFEYSVIGDVVNTASRLESFDKTVADPDFLPLRCRILIGASTKQFLNGDFETREIGGSLRVKGKEKEITVFQVLDEINRNANPQEIK